MAMIPDEFLDELRQRNNIVSVVSKYTPLEKKGNRFWGRCPFHIEKTPSFSVNEIDQFYYCFGCKAAGDVIKFVSEIESISFVDAIKMIAEWSGLEVPVDEAGREQAQRQKQERDLLQNCMRECAKHYRENLLKSNDALLYLKNRGIDKDMINRFGIGYSSGYQEIIEYLKTKGFDKDVLFRAGIIKEKDGRFYDAIGERIAFPIIDIYGNVVAFSGRTMQKNPEYAKYINTAETPIFSKSKNLFGINLVKKAKQNGVLREIIIVEGQTDVIALHKAGYFGTVASLGTALTVDQARIIKRLTNDVIICYDGDYAGTKATLRGLDILKHENLNVRVASLPDKMDPDELLRERGTEAIDKLIEDSKPLVEYKLYVLKDKYNLKEFDGKAKYVDEAIDILLGLDEVEAEVYINYISDTTGVYKDFLRSKLKDRSLKLTENNMVKTSAVKREVKKDSTIHMAEVCVLANILRRTIEDYNGEKLIELLPEELKKVGVIAVSCSSTAEFISALNSDEHAEIVGAVVNYNFSEDEETNKNLFEDCLWLVYKAKLLEKQSYLSERLLSGVSDSEKTDIMNELKSIIAKINSKHIDNEYKK